MFQASGFEPRGRGFTLVELLVAVGIIGVLASVSIVSVNSVRAKGRDAKRISEMKQLQNALEAFYSSYGSYPLGDNKAVAVTNLGQLAGAAAVDGDELVLCATKEAAPNAGYGGYGFGYVNTGSAADGDGKCIGGTVMMEKVPKDPLAPTASYTYTAKECAGAAPDYVAPCVSYEVKFKLEAGTGTYPGNVELKATPSGISQ